jgi:FkbM family methyltransferase
MAPTMGRLPDPLKRGIRDLLGRLGLEVIPRRSDRWLREANIRTVIDVGANRGQFARTARALFPDSRIYSFEPLTDCHAELAGALGRDPRFRAFNLAIGDEEGSITMHRNMFDASSSMLEMNDVLRKNFPFTGPASELTVPMQRLDTVCRDLPMESEVLVKMDVQGYEDRVIAGGRETIGRASVVLAEVSFEPLYAGQPLFSAIDGALKDLGFRYHGSWEQIVSPLDGRVLQADAIFLRDRPAAGARTA